MPKFQIEIEDVVNPETGKPGIKYSGSVVPGTYDPQGAVTIALAIGATINRLWEQGALVPLTRCVSPDFVEMIQQTSGVPPAAELPTPLPTPDSGKVVDLNTRRG